MTTQCGAITREGRRCQASVSPGAQWCFNHDPARAEERKRNARRAGKARGGGAEIVGIKALLTDLTDRVLAGDLETSSAAVANQLINTRLRAVELERKIRETEELEARIEQLEQTAEVQKGGRKWGA